MPIINAFKCRQSGKIFDMSDRQKILKHLKKLRVDNHRRYEFIKAGREFETMSRDVRENIRTREELAEFLVKNIQRIVDGFVATSPDASYYKRSSERYEKTVLDSVVIGQFLNIEQLRNSHSCPFSGVENWRNDPALPQHYPGLSVRLEYYYYKGCSSLIGAALQKFGIHLGSGGGVIPHDNKPGFMKYTGTIFWLDDWPGFAEDFVFGRLAGRKTSV